MIKHIIIIEEYQSIREADLTNTHRYTISAIDSLKKIPNTILILSTCSTSFISKPLAIRFDLIEYNTPVKDTIQNLVSDIYSEKNYGYCIYSKDISTISVLGVDKITETEESIRELFSYKRLNIPHVQAHSMLDFSTTIFNIKTPPGTEVAILDPDTDRLIITRTMTYSYKAANEFFPCVSIEDGRRLPTHDIIPYQRKKYEI